MARVREFHAKCVKSTHEAADKHKEHAAFGAFRIGIENAMVSVFLLVVRVAGRFQWFERRAL